MKHALKLPDTARLRELAVTAGVDPRTLKKILVGAKVRGMAGRRARTVLVGAGLLTSAAAFPEAKPRR